MKTMTSESDRNKNRNTRFDSFNDSTVGFQDRIVDLLLTVTKLSIGREGTSNVSSITIILGPHIEQTMVMTLN